MKASNLILHLQALIAQHGDLPVVFEDAEGILEQASSVQACFPMKENNSRPYISFEQDKSKPAWAFEISL